VTGDHPRALGIDRSPRWGGESFDVVAATVAAGVPASVAESPASPGPRVERVIAKERAGASMVILNHGGDPPDLVDFAHRCRDAGATVPMLAPVPIVVDPVSAARLDRFPGLRLPTGLTAAVATSRAPRREGIARAAALAADLMQTGVFAGVNLSGPAGIPTAEARLSITAELLDAMAV
jgi:5,10-methylenetetrahydrofolate reductase